MKVALVYDRVNKWGGAERVLLVLHQLFPKAPLYTSVYNPKTAQWAEVFRVRTSFLQNIPFASSFHELLAPFMPFAFMSFSFERYDVVISITSEYAKAIRVTGKTIHICYCLTPTRYLWSGYREYFRNKYFRFIAKPVILLLRFWDKRISSNPHYFVSISQEVKNRVKKYYKRDSQVVYPPVTILNKKNKSSHTLSGYFLIVSRLVPYKRIDIAITACNSLKVPLIIIGKGSEEKRLKKIAGSSVFFINNLTDEELSGYYKNCKALLFPGKEDFGLSIVEAQGFGKPVIAYKKGGAAEIIKEGKTGIFFDHQRKESLIKTIKKFEKMHFNPLACKLQAEKFTQKQFKKEFMKVIKEVLKK